MYALEACRLNCLWSKHFVFGYVGCNTAPFLKLLTGSANQGQSQYFQSKSEIHSVVSHSLQPCGLYHPWNSPGQKVGSLSLLQGIFPIQGLNPSFLHCRQILYQLSYRGSPRILEWVAYPFFSRSSQPRSWNRDTCIAGRFFTNWAIREALIQEDPINSLF